MPIKVLIVDKDLNAGSSIVGSLGKGEMEVIFIPHSERAINAVTRNEYSIIVLGDKLIDHGDTYDVGLAIKNSPRSKRLPVICVGANRSRKAKLVALLAPYSYSVDVSNNSEIEVCATKVRDHLKSLTDPPVKKA